MSVEIISDSYFLVYAIYYLWLGTNLFCFELNINGLNEGGIEFVIVAKMP